MGRVYSAEIRGGGGVLIRSGPVFNKLRIAQKYKFNQQRQNKWETSVDLLQKNTIWRFIYISICNAAAADRGCIKVIILIIKIAPASSMTARLLIPTHLKASALTAFRDNSKSSVAKCWSQFTKVSFFISRTSYRCVQHGNVKYFANFCRPCRLFRITITSVNRPDWRKLESLFSSSTVVQYRFIYLFLRSTKLSIQIPNSFRVQWANQVCLNISLHLPLWQIMKKYGNNATMRMMAQSPCPSASSDFV